MAQQAMPARDCPLKNKESCIKPSPSRMGSTKIHRISSRGMARSTQWRTTPSWSSWRPALQARKARHSSPRRSPPTNRHR